MQDNVVDFRWHKSTQSPNWSLLGRESWMKAEKLPSVATEGDHVVSIDDSKLPQWVKYSAVAADNTSCIESSSSSSSSSTNVGAILTDAIVESSDGNSTRVPFPANSSTLLPNDDEDEL